MQTPSLVQAPSQATQEALRAEFLYDPHRGELRRKTGHRGPQALRRAYVTTTVQLQGGPQVPVRVRSADLAWFLYTGAWPKDRVTRANGVIQDLRWENLMLRSEAVRLCRELGLHIQGA